MRCRGNCIGFSLDDGVHGVVVWDMLYALFVITTTMSIFVNQIKVGKLNQSFTGMVTMAFLTVRAGVGISSCCYNFQLKRVKYYLILRLAWDGALILYNIIMAAAFQQIEWSTLFMQLFVLVLVDGYLNFTIYSYLTQRQQLSLPD